MSKITSKSLAWTFLCAILTTTVTAYSTGMNPGVMVRLEQQTINEFKRAMEMFLPHYVNFDMEFPSEYDYTFKMFFGLINWHIEWSDITYKDAKLNLRGTEIDLTTILGRENVISVKVPAIESWQIEAWQRINFPPSSSKIQLIFQDFKFDFKTGLVLNKNGYLDPIVQSCDISFGKSHLHHDNPIIGFVMHQFVYFGVVIVENSIFFIGDYVFTNMLGPVVDRSLNHYQLDFVLPSLVRGQQTFDNFGFDFRSVRDPALGDGTADFFLTGDLLYDDLGCALAPTRMEFMDKPDGDYSQIVVSESVAACFANQIARSDIGLIRLDAEKVRMFWGLDEKMDFTTSSMATHFPLFQDLFGPDVPLRMELTFRDFRVAFE